MENNGKELADKVIGNIAKVIVGKQSIIRLLLTALVADGHVLLEDVPGTGKTKLAKSIAKSLSAEFSRIQFTPDLLPSDITGLNLFNREKNQFVFQKGPVFTHILLADEINRATPRTQSGLLECMEEQQVTIDGISYPLEPLFFVIATQNPIESAGTFPLPEAQMDRFMMRLSLGFPDQDQELTLLQRYLLEDPLHKLQHTISLADIQTAKEEANRVFVHESILQYILAIIAETRNTESIFVGVSPRGSLALLRSAKAYAYLEGRTYVIPDDVKSVAVAVLAHRLVLAYGNHHDTVQLMEQILNKIPVPTEQFTEEQ